MTQMKICDIRPGNRDIEVVGRISNVGSKREVQTRFGPAIVAYAILEDGTASIRLNLWKDQIDRVKEGDRVQIVNGFTREFGGQLELNTEKDGNLIVLTTSTKHENQRH
jgi:ssDNA-binding replication factor A large subunit